ncbi:MAG: DUF4160 domain-containing protein [Isosphaeraceae bacterium]
MYYNDHAPPHFHAEYAEDEALFMAQRCRYRPGRLVSRS